MALYLFSWQMPELKHRSGLEGEEIVEAAVFTSPLPRGARGDRSQAAPRVPNFTSSYGRGGSFQGVRWRRRGWGGWATANEFAAKCACPVPRRR